jgi:hypothetical protein
VVVDSGARSNLMEDNGARSNPQAKVELSQLVELHVRLVARAALNPILPRVAPSRLSPVLGTVTRVLEEADRPLRAREIHAAAELVAGRPLLWSSVKGTLAAYSGGDAPRFRRISRGVYELTSRQSF